MTYTNRGVHPKKTVAFRTAVGIGSILTSSLSIAQCALGDGGGGDD